MITAEEARKLSEESYKNSVEDRLKEIGGAVKAATIYGNRSVEIYVGDRIRSEVTQELVKAGFKVTPLAITSCILEISW